MIIPAPPKVVSDLLRGNGAAFLGDSITASNVDYANGAIGSGSWGVMACMASGQRIRYVRNAGISGDTTTQMLARLNADVIAFQPDICFILGGTNDIGASVPQSTIRANLTAIYTRLRAARIQPIACTVTPRSASTGNQGVELLNAWIRAYCGRHGIWVADLAAAVTDPGTFGWLGGGTVNNVDGLHPNAKGSRLMAQRAIADVADLIPNAAPYVPLYADTTTAGANLLKNALFMSDGNADGVADVWTFSGSTSGVTNSLQTVSGVVGKVERSVVTVSGLRFFQQDVGSSLWSVGDRLALSGVVTTSGIEAGGMTVTAAILFTGGSPNQCAALSIFALDVNQWRFYAEAVVPSGTTMVSVRLISSASGTGTVEWGQVSLINLTRLGIV